MDLEYGDEFRIARELYRQLISEEAVLRLDRLEDNAALCYWGSQRVWLNKTTEVIKC